MTRLARRLRYASSAHRCEIESGQSWVIAVLNPEQKTGAERAFHLVERALPRTLFAMHEKCGVDLLCARDERPFGFSCNSKALDGALVPDES